MPAFRSSLRSRLRACLHDQPFVRLISGLRARMLAGFSAPPADPALALANHELEACGLGVIRWVPGRRLAAVSESVWNLAGAPPGSIPQATPVRALWRLLDAAERQRLRPRLAALLSGDDEPVRLELRARAHGGLLGWFDTTLALTAPSHEHPAHLFIALRDVSVQHAALDRQRLYAHLFEHLHDGLLITDDSGRVLDMNPAVTAMTGYSRADLLGHIPGFTAGLQPIAHAPALPAPSALPGWRGETVGKRPDGASVALSLSASRMPTAEHHGLRAVVMSDVTLAHQHRDRLERRSQFDELTGLPTRSLLMPALRTAMSQALAEGFRLTVCMLSLDDFAGVQARRGPAVADELLVALASRLRQAVRARAEDEPLLSRLGGDEFVLLLRTATSLEARHAIERLLVGLQQPYVLDGEEVVAGASLGATIYPHDEVDADTLLRHADHALYRARQAGRHGYVVFDADHDRRTKEQLQAVAVIQDGFLADEFVLHYQPKVDLRRGRVLGVEALLRWRHPKRGLVAPAQFLPFIEHTELGVRVGDWVLQRGIAQLADWLARGLALTVSVNISARHLQQPDFAPRLAGLLALHGPRVASHLVIEVLETAALEDVAHTRTLMRDCRALGVRFALDDFGTGYSTFTYLRQLPLDLLKIDQSFVRHMLDDRQDLAIVEGVIALSRQFGCEVIAEGVETAAHAERLIQAGCEVGQGNGIAAAMPAEEIEAWVQGYHRAQARHDDEPVAAA